ncbi:hypothetical protein ACLKA7_005566 [Drosophila subpalustris]
MSLTTSTRKRKIAAAIILHCCLEEEEEQELKLRTRTTWVQELYLEREESGFFRSFQSIFRSNSPDCFKDFVRMNPDDPDIRSRAPCRDSSVFGYWGLSLRA